MRTITEHVVEGDTAPQVKIFVPDSPGPGGANHYYEISWKQENEKCNLPYGSISVDFPKQQVGTATGQGGDTLIIDDPLNTSQECAVSFQCGPIKEVGVNGVTESALLAILLDRLRSFQAGPFPSEYNEHAIRHGEQMLWMLQGRTRERIARGVEGTYQK